MTTKEQDLHYEMTELKQNAKQYEDERNKMMETLKTLKDKIISIEQYYGNEIMAKFNKMRVKVHKLINGKKSKE